MVSVEQWRAAIGRWARGPRLLPGGVLNCNSLLFCSISLAVIGVLLMIGGVEQNPGPVNPTPEDLQTLREGQQNMFQMPNHPHTHVRSNEMADFREAVMRLESRVVALESENKFLTRKLDYLENQSRRSNLLFFGLEEQQGESWEDSETVVQDVAAQLGVKLSDKDLDRAHRIGRRRGRRPIVAKFSSYKKKEEMLQAAAKYLRGAIRVAEDHSATVRQTRKELFPYMQESRAKGHRASIRFDKLVIDGHRYTLDQIRAEEGEGQTARTRRHAAGRRSTTAAADSAPAAAAAASTSVSTPAAAASATSTVATAAASTEAFRRRGKPKKQAIADAATAGAAAAPTTAAVPTVPPVGRRAVPSNGTGVNPSDPSRGPALDQRQAKARAAAAAAPAAPAPPPPLNNPTGAVASGIPTTSTAAVPGCSGKADTSPPTLNLKELEDIKADVLQFLENLRQENQREFLK